jgi:hypothetical protein
MDLTMNAKRVVTLVVIVFLGFWMFTDPTSLARIVTDGGNNGWSVATDLFTAVIDFIKQL